LIIHPAKFTINRFRFWSGGIISGGFLRDRKIQHLGNFGNADDEVVIDFVENAGSAAKLPIQ
jgi:hypothetical protein